MSTRPYMTNGKLRLRQLRNRRLIECRGYYSEKQPLSSSTRDWLEFHAWVRARENQIRSECDTLIEQARQQERRSKHERRNRR